MSEKKPKSIKEKLAVKNIAKELKKPGLIVLGMIGGTLIGKAIDKIIKLDETAEGFQPKALVKPITLFITGLGGAILIENENVKYISSGVAASGIASGVKVFFKKDILNGFGDAEIEHVFSRPINLSIDSYNPDLPPISQNAEYNYKESPYNLEEQVGELTDYQEVGEIGIL